MKWTLDIKKKDIDLEILNERFALITNGCDIQFGINHDIACKMLLQLRAVMQKPWTPEEEMVEHVDNETMIMNLARNCNAYSVIDMRFGNKEFHASLTRREIERFTQILGRYLLNGLQSKKQSILRV